MVRGAGSQTDTLPFFPGELDGFVYSEIEDHWNTHYSRAIENQLDVVHVPIVHYNTIGRGNKTLINGPKVIFEDGNLITSANNEEDHGQLAQKTGRLRDQAYVFEVPLSQPLDEPHQRENPRGDLFRPGGRGKHGAVYPLLLQNQRVDARGRAASRGWASS